MSIQQVNSVDNARARKMVYTQMWLCRLLPISKLYCLPADTDTNRLRTYPVSDLLFFVICANHIFQVNVKHYCYAVAFNKMKIHKLFLKKTLWGMTFNT